MDASLSSNTYNCRRNSVTVIAAQQDNYLLKTLDKVWKALTFLNDYTDGGFFKLRQVSDTQLLKKASHYKIVNGQKIETGWMSQIQGINADKPNKIRGDRTDLLIYEEGGSWPNSTKAFIQGDALTGIQGARFGIKIIGGTGGDSGPALEGLRDIYENPDVYDVLKYRHRYTQSGQEVLTGFFIPAYNIVNREGYIDNRGFTDPELGKQYYDKERAKKAGDPKALLIYCAEYCYNSEEAFQLEGDNKFNKIAIADQLTRIRILNEGPKVQKGFLEYTYREGKRDKDHISGFKWIPDEKGKIKIIEHPLWTNSGEEKTNNLYVAGIDSIDIGQQDTSEYTKDPSQFCIVIKKRVFGLQEPQYVAYYKDRPQDVREAYKIAIRLAEYYNAPINIEATRMSMISWARDNGYLKYFMRRPRATYPDPTQQRRNTYGSPATIAVISHQTDLIADFIEDYCYNIWFEEMLTELSQYNDDNKTKFDIVAALGMAELADEELTGIIPRVVEEYKEDEFQDVGYYIDENGYKRFGLIPRKIEYKINVNNNYIYSNNIVKSSDPRRLL